MGADAWRHARSAGFPLDKEALPRDEDAPIVARATTACRFWTVRVAKGDGTGKRGRSGWAAAMNGHFTLLGRRRCRRGGAKNDCSGKHKFYSD